MKESEAIESVKRIFNQIMG